MLGIFLDQETTGLDSSRHKLLEIAIKVVDLSSGKEVASYESVLTQPEAVFKASDPQALEVNGFSFKTLEQGKTEAEVGKEIIDLFTTLGIVRKQAVFICQNPSFDRAFFAHLVAPYEQEKRLWPYHWLDLASMYWAIEVKKSQNQERDLPPEITLSKDTIAKSLGLPGEEKPHRAMHGVDHLLLCYSRLVGYCLCESMHR